MVLLPIFLDRPCYSRIHPMLSPLDCSSFSIQQSTGFHAVSPICISMSLSKYVPPRFSSTLG
ncbi:hypothetical protein J1N35_031876 [Gossypium stocksii]|uniref:Uncharacterized protein n=1 Tax=Gossypium stocksii TaxID=47602 RepID=A0A9D3V531_9ROSI|nr:hypothetical protein J1N35_031876 [Gossypium stocksii]